MSEENYRIAAFYEFRRMSGLLGLREQIRELMHTNSVKGTVLLADEGYNATVSGKSLHLDQFISELGSILGISIEPKVSEHNVIPFRKVEVKIKKEIVTLKHPVSFENGVGNFVDPKDWNDLISRPDVVLLDARNDYEYRSGTFPRAVNSGTEKFSELPNFVKSNLGAAKDKTVAMFCTGGIRCEKFAPYLAEQGFTNVYHLRGGVLKYLEEVSPDEQLWSGECFVFDDRRSVDKDLKKGVLPDLSQKEPKAGE